MTLTEGGLALGGSARRRGAAQGSALLKQAGSGAGRWPGSGGSAGGAPRRDEGAARAGLALTLGAVC